MCARTMLNKEKTVQMSDFIPNCFITVSKIMLLRNVWRAGRQSCLKRCIWLNLEVKDVQSFF